MISITGPIFVEPGSTVCITASGVGAGFSARALSSGAAVSLKLKHNPAKHTVTICFKAPEAGQSVTIHVADSSSTSTVSHTVAT